VALVDQAALAADIRRVAGIGEGRDLAEDDLRVFPGQGEQERILVE
jgi:hypothetical protein